MSDFKMTDEWEMVVDGHLIGEQHYDPKWAQYDMIKKHLVAFLETLHAVGLLKDEYCVQVNNVLYEQLKQKLSNQSSRLAELEGELNRALETVVNQAVQLDAIRDEARGLCVVRGSVEYQIKRGQLIDRLAAMDTGGWSDAV